MRTRIDATAAANAEIGVNLDLFTGRFVAVLDRTGANAGVAVHAPLGINTDNRCQAISCDVRET